MVFALTTMQIWFIVIASVIGAIILLILILVPTMRFIHRRYYKKYYYRLIYRIALYNDYYLVNNFVFRLNQNDQTTIDHILFGEKFIYVIMDNYFAGDLLGNAEDQSLVLINKNGSKNYVNNPYYSFNSLLSRFAAATGISTDLMVGVTIVNNNCRMSITSNSKQFFMVQRKQFRKLVKLVESRDIGDINADRLQAAVLLVDEMNRKNKK